MARKARFGTVSHGTLKTDDLIGTFADELRAVRGAIPKGLYKHLRMWQEGSKEIDPAELVNDLTDALNECAPPYGYFGAHEGDGSDFGFWLRSDWEEGFDGLRVSDTSEVPADYNGEVIHVNDHGNVTLYWSDPANAHRSSARLTEIWSVV